MSEYAEFIDLGACARCGEDDEDILRFDSCGQAKCFYCLELEGGNSNLKCVSDEWGEL